MTLRGKMFGIGLLICCLPGGTHTVAAAETMRIGGTGAATAMFPQLFAAFERGKDAGLQIVPSLGTSGGLRALNDGALDVAVSGRALTSEERALGLTQRVAIRTPYVLITSHQKPNGVKRAEIAELFKSKATWMDGSAIRIILRPKSDSDSAVLSGMFPGMADAMEQARKRPDIPVAATDQDSADMAERITSSLAGSTFTQILTEKRNLRFVAIDGTAPSMEALESGAYPYAKTLYFVLPARQSALAGEFMTFLDSPAGHAALRAVGNLPVAD